MRTPGQRAIFYAALLLVDVILQVGCMYLIMKGV